MQFNYFCRNLHKVHPCQSIRNFVYNALVISITWLCHVQLLFSSLRNVIFPFSNHFDQTFDLYFFYYKNRLLIIINFQLSRVFCLCLKRKINDEWLVILNFWLFSTQTCREGGVENGVFGRNESQLCQTVCIQRAQDGSCRLGGNEEWFCYNRFNALFSAAEGSGGHTCWPRISLKLVMLTNFHAVLYHYTKRWNSTDSNCKPALNRNHLDAAHNSVFVNPEWISYEIV